MIPVYFWANREGGRLARESLDLSDIRVLTAYARRPKVRHPGDDQIVMRMNEELYVAASRGAEMGCPVLAGIPLVSTLRDLVLGAPCRWFLVHGTGLTEGVPDLVRIETRSGELPEHPVGVSAVDAGDIAAIAANARRMSWGEAVNAIRSLRTPYEEFQGWWGRGSYRPFHLLLVGG